MNNEDSILFLGDVVPYKPFKFKNKYKAVFNIECPITTNGRPVTSKINLKVSENYLKNIFGDNMLCVCISNNHILDYGKEGLESTLSELKKTGIKPFGLNAGDENKCAPLAINFRNLKIAFFAVVCQSTSPVTKLDNKIYLNLLNLDSIISSINEVRKSVQRVVLYIHWGEEESSYPAKKDVLIARKLIDAGADVIIGSHAHAPQPIEKYKNGIIAYNMGNFLMPAMKKVPSYYNERQIPLSSYTKYLMLWNRISWGLIVDMESMEYKIKMYLSIFNRNIELPFASLYKYVKLPKNILNTGYELQIKKHLRKRAIYRKLTSFIIEPHIPQKLKRIL